MKSAIATRDWYALELPGQPRLFFCMAELDTRYANVMSARDVARAALAKHAGHKRSLINAKLTRFATQPERLRPTGRTAYGAPVYFQDF